MAGQVGFDEGGVLQALATPILHVEEVTTKTYKSGRTKVTTATLEFTGAHVMAFMLGASLLGLFVRGREGVKDVFTDPEESRQFLRDTVPFFGRIADPKVATGVGTVAKKAFDPFGVFS